MVERVLLETVGIAEAEPEPGLDALHLERHRVATRPLQVLLQQGVQSQNGVLPPGPHQPTRSEPNHEASRQHAPVRFVDPRATGQSNTPSR